MRVDKILEKLNRIFKKPHTNVIRDNQYAIVLCGDIGSIITGGVVYDIVHNDSIWDLKNNDPVWVIDHPMMMDIIRKRESGKLQCELTKSWMN